MVEIHFSLLVVLAFTVSTLLYRVLAWNVDKKREFVGSLPNVGQLIVSNCNGIECIEPYGVMVLVLRILNLINTLFQSVHLWTFFLPLGCAILDIM